MKIQEVRYILNNKLIYTTDTNYKILPRINERVMIEGQLTKVEDIQHDLNNDIIKIYLSHKK